MPYFLFFKILINTDEAYNGEETFKVINIKNRKIIFDDHDERDIFSIVEFSCTHCLSKSKDEFDISFKVKFYCMVSTS